MNTPLIVIAVIAIAALIIYSTQHRDPAAEACAKDLIELLRSNKEASPQAIAEIYRAHNRSTTDVGKVSKLIKSRLVQAGFRQEEHEEVMQRVRAAKQLLKD